MTPVVSAWATREKQADDASWSKVNPFEQFWCHCNIETNCNKIWQNQDGWHLCKLYWLLPFLYTSVTWRGGQQPSLPFPPACPVSSDWLSGEVASIAQHRKQHSTGYKSRCLIGGEWSAGEERGVLLPTEDLFRIFPYLNTGLSDSVSTKIIEQQ